MSESEVNKQLCENCRFSRVKRLHNLSGEYRELSGIYECLFNPPTVIAAQSFADSEMSEHTVWPTVHKDDWCGKWES